MSGFGYSNWSYDQFEKMVIFPPDPLSMPQSVVMPAVNPLRCQFPSCRLPPPSLAPKIASSSVVDILKAISRAFLLIPFYL